jgi:hypothetical protein
MPDPDAYEAILWRRRNVTRPPLSRDSVVDEVERGKNRTKSGVRAK